jgi:hypothetical protein
MVEAQVAALSQVFFFLVSKEFTFAFYRERTEPKKSCDVYLFE